jgi:glycosyltransferase involved in cell wall biosynthesis
VRVNPLGVDLEYFYPVRTEGDRGSRNELRARLGFSEGDIVCIYTGRFGEDKNPALLARAIGSLREQGEPFRGLFVGAGVQAKEILTSPGCLVQPFVPFQELGHLFRAADIGVWPTQESTSMIDAAACGLPTVVNDTVVATERVDGNGVVYRLNDLDSLIAAIRSLRSVGRRVQLGAVGATKMAAEFGWDAIARRRLQEYAAAADGAA